MVEKNFKQRRNWNEISKFRHKIVSMRTKCETYPLSKVSNKPVQCHEILIKIYIFHCENCEKSDKHLFLSLKFMMQLRVGLLEKWCGVRASHQLETSLLLDIEGQSIWLVCTNLMMVSLSAFSWKYQVWWLEERPTKKQDGTKEEKKATNIQNCTQKMNIFF